MGCTELPERFMAKVTFTEGGCPAAVNALKTHCIHGHEFTPTNTYVGKNRAGLMRRCRCCHAQSQARRQARVKEKA